MIIVVREKGRRTLEMALIMADMVVWELRAEVGRNLAEFERSKARESEAEGQNPEAEDDLGFGPALLLEMVVDRRHEEEARARAGAPLRPLEPADLEDDRERLHHEDAADDHQREGLVDHEGHDA